MSNGASDLSFDGRVVIITGAGNGLGRSHALEFAAHGARVVVNDLGGDAFGGGSGTRAADAVVEQIKANGGEAVANYDSVTDGDKVVQTALDTWGRVDIVVNNAGILRDVSFHKMTPEDWDLVYQVHVLGSMKVTRAAWPHMRQQQYGRVLMTSSAAGIYGNFGQANYGFAKLGLLGFSNTLAIEGARYCIQVNTIAPVAGSRLTETVLPPQLIDALKPEYVTPLAVWLCHEACEDTGGLFEVGGGFFGKLRWQRAAGKLWRVGRSISASDVRAAWDDVVDFGEAPTYPTSVMESFGPIIGNVEKGPSKGGNALIDVDAALGFEFPERTSTYDERDLALYALGIGAAQDPLGHDLQHVYELHGDGFRPIPSYGVIPCLNFMVELYKRGENAPGLNYGFERILHGEQYTKIERPLPPSAELTHRAKITDIFDKGKGALVVTEVQSFDEDGDLLITNKFVSFIRGAGGWGGDRGPSVEVNVPPERAPDFVVEEKTSDNQALLYRLSGDWNPLHADPAFAQAMSFDRPILHGLCTFGFATRHVLSKCAPDGDVRYFESISVRFAKSVYPGDTLVTEMWKDGRTIVFRTKVKERDEVVLSHACITLYESIPKKRVDKAAKEAAPDAASSGQLSQADSGPTSADVFGAIGAWMGQNADRMKAINKVFQFRLSAPDSVWTLDCGDAKALPGEAKKADCTLAMSNADFLAMVSGEKDAMKMYMSKELQISGDLMASQKLDFLKDIDLTRIEAAGRAPAGNEAATAEPTPDRQPVAPRVFNALRVSAGGDRKIVVAIVEPDSEWTVDFKTGQVSPGASADFNARITLSDIALERFLGQQVSEQALFQHGDMRVDGDVALAKDLSWMKGV